MIFRKKEPPLEVIVGPESGIKGDLATRGVVKLDGTIEGSIAADWLIVGETGRVQGNVRARGTVVYGTVEGNIDSEEITEIHSKAVVEGDVTTSKLVVDEGAVFEGRSRMQGASRSKEVLSLAQKLKKSLTE